MLRERCLRASPGHRWQHRQSLARAGQGRAGERSGRRARRPAQLRGQPGHATPATLTDVHPVPHSPLPPRAHEEAESSRDGSSISGAARKKAFL